MGSGTEIGVFRCCDHLRSNGVASLAGFVMGDAAPAKRSHKAKPPALDPAANHITGYFTPRPQVGRPSGVPIKKRGRPAASSVEPVPAPAVPEAAAAAPARPSSSSGAMRK